MILMLILQRRVSVLGIIVTIILLIRFLGRIDVFVKIYNRLVIFVVLKN